ncbi:B12-binding domain-containing radical SAM protein [Methylobacterium durans]|uniref:B12-binding domain-containing radical SAM protein n=1 Tax=Methylobacterium durans TaxID=2202825 RepID=A0A2U8WGK3_9HYPH|nr:radical SAM protein [Methylobacterium durans]AWN44530.1 B12-binding domain-containing radical SAM protein [Methylobacterium durans]
MSALRTGRRVALVAQYPERDPAMPSFVPNLGLRMVEASIRAAGFPDLACRTWDLAGGDAGTVAREILAFDPDIVGFSAYLWSLPFLCRVAALIKQDDPGRLVVFGGPSARPVMFAKPPFSGYQEDIDVLVINEGEETFREIVSLTERRPSALGALRGVAVKEEQGWRETPARPLADLDSLASPYALDLVQHGGLGVLQTYRGCPFTCSFCEWGTMESPKRVRAVDHLDRELQAIARHDVYAALLVDAGLNLNRNAFLNLKRAAEESGFFERHGLICEVYPAAVRQEHLDFLGSVSNAYVGIGLQSFDNAVLAHVDRTYDERRFDETFGKLDAVASLAVEIILGLPGDNPETFRRNFERARRLPCALRVYHCVVLPSGLMVRSPPEHRLDYDPVTLKMISCTGWSEAALQAECRFLTRQATLGGGRTGEFFWTFPPPR